MDKHLIPNTLGMKLKLIPAGTFLMGSPVVEVGAKLFCWGVHEENLLGFEWLEKQGG
jgi:hypothetical protein